MPQIRLPHSVIMKSPGLLPMHYKTSELALAIGLPERTLREWLKAGAPHFRDARGHIWIHGREFSEWVTGLRKPARERKLRDDEAFCMRCRQAVTLTDTSIKPMKGKLILIRGKCPNCGCTINRGGRIPTYHSNTTTQKGSKNDN